MNPSPMSREVLFGELRFAGEETGSNALPLKRTNVTVQVTGPLASVVVTQSFANPMTSPVELEYLFPLPEKAAVVDFELLLGKRRVKGDLQELEQAHAAYDQANQAGQQAGLFEQRRPNLFSIHLANVLPGESIQATMRYQEPVKFDDGMYEFVFPMGITPKYDRRGQTEEAARTQAPLAKPGEAIGPVTISLALDAGMRVEDPTSPSHAMQVTRMDERRFQVQLAGEVIPNKDFVMRYELVQKTVAASAWTSESKTGSVFLASLVPPRLSEDYLPQPREFIFVLDRSGSMTGDPIAQARNALRACLRTLNPDDRFRILLFDDVLEWYDHEPKSVSQVEIDRADGFLAQVQGRGGTEIIAALNVVLALPEDVARTRYVLFLTDGAVSAEAAALEAVRRTLGRTRLFTFGIGPSVNRALLNRLAVLGRGTAEFLQLNEDIEGAVIRFQDRVSFPLVKNLTMAWTNAKAWDIYPAQLPDLYAGQPLILCGLFTRQGNSPAQLVVSGLAGTQSVRMTVDLVGPPQSDPALARVWARLRVDDLLEQIALDPSQLAARRAEVIGLAIDHHLVTPFTAFVAVDQDIANPEAKSKTLAVAQPLPEGLERQGFARQSLSARPPMPTAAYTGMVASAKSASFPILSPISHLLSGKMSRSVQADTAAMPFEEAESRQVQETAPEALQAFLRWLARTQQLEGCWKGDVEITSAAMLTFVRAGHTTQTGSFRQAVRRAYEWLKNAQASGFALFARALALHTLAQATGLLAHQASAAQICSGLPAPATLLEGVVSDLLNSVPSQDLSGPSQVATLDDLRLAGILNLAVVVPEEVRQTNDLSIAWTASLI